MPGKKLFQRNTRELAEKREAIVNAFMRGVVRLPAEVSCSPVLLSFLESRKTDPKKAANNFEEEERENLSWDWMTEVKPEEITTQDLSHCYAGSEEDDDIDWSLQLVKESRLTTDYDSGHESTPASMTNSRDEGLDLAEVDVKHSGDGSDVIEEALKLEIDINSLTERSSQYYSLCYSQYADCFDESSMLAGDIANKTTDDVTKDIVADDTNVNKSIPCDVHIETDINKISVDSGIEISTLAEGSTVPDKTCVHDRTYDYNDLNIA